jgi:hypothetical protein
MIMMHKHGARCGPRIRCTICRSIIKDARTGVILWDGRRQDGEPLFVHAGDCCRRLEEGNPGVGFDSQPLSAWLIYLANGVRLRWLKAGKLAVALGEVG